MNLNSQQSELAIWMEEKLKELTSHPAWHGNLAGFEADALLRTQTPNTYLLRQGERADVFYLSFCSGVAVLHRPFSMDYASMQWFYRNGFPQCRHVLKPDLGSFIPEIIQQNEGDCIPLSQIARMR